MRLRAAAVGIAFLLVFQLVPTLVDANTAVAQAASGPQLPPDFQAEGTNYLQALQSVAASREVPITVEVQGQNDSHLASQSLLYNQTSSDFVAGITGSGWALPGFSSEATPSAWSSWSEVCGVTNVVELDWQEWGAVEPNPNEFVWSNADQQFNEVLSHCPGARFIVMFDDLSGYGQPWYNTTVPGWVPYNDLSNATAFQQFRNDLYGYVYHIVRRYREEVAYWLTENELGLSPAQTELGNSTEKAVQVDTTVISAIRAADPGARVMLSDSSYSASPDPYTFAQDVVQSGTKPDGIAIEAYAANPLITPFFYKEYIQSLESFGLPILIQETGYPSGPTTCAWATTPSGCWAGWGGVFSPQIQADWLKFVFTFALSDNNTVGIIWPFGIDENITDWQTFGLVGQNGTYKPAFYDYKQFVRSITTSGTAATNATGEATFVGFPGNYSLRIAGTSISYNVAISEGCDNRLVMAVGNGVSASCLPLKGKTWSLPNGTLYGLVTDGSYFTTQVANYSLISALDPGVVRDNAVGTQWWTLAWHYAIVETFPQANYIGLLGPNILSLDSCPSTTSSTGAEVYQCSWTLSDWNANVTKVVNENPGTHVWEVWLEPQWYQGGYLCCSDNVTLMASHYFDMLRDAYSIIKAHDPNGIVVALGGSGFYPSGQGAENWDWIWQFTSDVWGLGAGNYSDAISLHLFPGALLNETAWSGQSWQSIVSGELRQYEELTGKPVWITAEGMASSNGSTPERQAAFANQTFTLFSSIPYVKAVMWFWDYGIFDGSDWGLLTVAPANQQAPKPAYYVFKWFAGHSGSVPPTTNYTSSMSTTTAYGSRTATTSSSTSVTTTTSSSGGIPEFPFQAIAAGLLVAVVVASYLLARRSSTSNGRESKLKDGALAGTFVSAISNPGRCRSAGS